MASERVTDDARDEELRHWKALIVRECQMFDGKETQKTSSDHHHYACLESEGITCTHVQETLEEDPGLMIGYFDCFINFSSHSCALPIIPRLQVEIQLHPQHLPVFAFVQARVSDDQLAMEKKLNDMIASNWSDQWRLAHCFHELTQLVQYYDHRVVDIPVKSQKKINTNMILDQRDIPGTIFDIAEGMISITNGTILFLQPLAPPTQHQCVLQSIIPFQNIKCIEHSQECLTLHFENPEQQPARVIFCAPTVEPILELISTYVSTLHLPIVFQRSVNTTYQNTHNQAHQVYRATAASGSSRAKKKKASSSASASALASQVANKWMGKIGHYATKLFGLDEEDDHHHPTRPRHH